MALLPNLYRPTEGRVIAGVCAGVARSLDMDVKIVRVVMIVAALMGGIGVWGYPLLWVIMRDENKLNAPVDDLIVQAKEWNENRTSAQGSVSQQAPTQPSSAEPQPRPEPPMNPFQQN